MAVATMRSVVNDTRTGSDMSWRTLSCATVGGHRHGIPSPMVRTPRGGPMTAQAVTTETVQTPGGPIRVEWDVPIAMDDGVVLRADVFRPVADEPVPVLLSHGPYA